VVRADAHDGSLRTYLRLLRYLRPWWPAFAVSLLGFTLYAVTQSAFAGLMQYLPAAFDNPGDTALGRIGSRDLAHWERQLGLDRPERLRDLLPLAVVALVTLRGIGSFLGGYYITSVARRVVNQLRVDVFAHVNRLPGGWLATHNSAEILSLLTFNIEQVASAASTAIRIIVREGLTVSVLLAYIFWLNWKLSLLFVVLAPLIGGIVGLASRQFRKYSRRIQDSMGGITRVAAEALRGHAVVRSFGGEASENRRFRERSDYALRQDMKLARVNEISTPVIQWLSYAALAVLFWVGLDPALRGSMDAGEFLAYITAASLVSKPLRQLTNVNVRVQRGIAAAESVFAVLDEPTEAAVRGRTATARLPARVHGGYRLRGLTFRYPGADRDCLRGIDLDIAAGETVALVGRSGAGKSTLANLLAGLLPAPPDQLWLDGVPLDRVSPDELRRQVAVVSQDTTLFAASVAENVAYGELAGAPRDAIWKALGRANAREFVERLPQGLDTVLREGADNLSGGQRQRLALARAFLKDAPVLVLDEPTSAQDAQSEAQIREALARVVADRTAVVIAHRLGTITAADRILVLERGRLVEAGRHGELLAAGGLYADLFRRQDSDGWAGR